MTIYLSVLPSVQMTMCNIVHILHMSFAGTPLLLTFVLFRSQGLNRSHMQRKTKSEIPQYLGTYTRGHREDGMSIHRFIHHTSGCIEMTKSS